MKGAVVPDEFTQAEDRCFLIFFSRLYIARESPSEIFRNGCNDLVTLKIRVHYENFNQIFDH